MSTSFYLTCTTCDPTGQKGLGRWDSLTYQDKALAALLPHLPLFAAVHRAGFSVETGSLSITGNHHALRDIGLWASTHEGHHVSVISQHGEFQVLPPELATVSPTEHRIPISSIAVDEQLAAVKRLVEHLTEAVESAKTR